MRNRETHFEQVPMELLQAVLLRVMPAAVLLEKSRATGVAQQRQPVPKSLVPVNSIPPGRHS
jgi:hypothetical protein